MTIINKGNTPETGEHFWIHMKHEPKIKFPYVN